MNQSITVHLRGPVAFENVLRCLEDTIGHPFVKVEHTDWDAYRTTSLGLEFSVYESRDYEDDCGISFTQYAYVVSVDCRTGWIEENDNSVLQELGGRIVAIAVWRMLGCECIVVRNLQHLVARYGEPQNTALRTD